MNDRSKLNLYNVHPQIIQTITTSWPRIQKLEQTFDCKIMIICGHRPQKEQDALYRIGRRGIKGEAKVTWTRKSKHTESPAMAVDFGLFRGKFYLDSARPKEAAEIYKALAAILCHPDGKEQPLIWGGLFGDDPHFQLT